jgi:hypothetical protein
MCARSSAAVEKQPQLLRGFIEGEAERGLTMGANNLIKKNWIGSRQAMARLEVLLRVQPGKAVGAPVPVGK